MTRCAESFEKLCTLKRSGRNHYIAKTENRKMWPLPCKPLLQDSIVDERRNEQEFGHLRITGAWGPELGLAMKKYYDHDIPSMSCVEVIFKMGQKKLTWRTADWRARNANAVH
jgi:hypothetical protein